MCSRFSTRRPRLCTTWTAVAPEAVFTRRTKAPTPRDYPRRQAPLVTTSAPIHGQTPTSAAPTITRSPERYKSGQTVVAFRLEQVVEPLFHPDSYGYRPRRSALDAVAACRQRC